jgi:Immunity protein Imm1
VSIKDVAAQLDTVLDKIDAVRASLNLSDGRGVVRYSGRDWPRGVVSVNDDEPSDGEERSYFYMGHWRGFPANSEIPLDLVRAAIKEFMATDGARPECIRWQTAS